MGDRLRMMGLLHKFRIQAEVVVIQGENKIADESVAEYEQLGIAVDDPANEPERARRFIRMRDIIHAHSKEASLIVAPLPVPRTQTDPRAYMTWIDFVSAGLQ